MTWAHYLLQVNIYLVIFYVFYKLLLDKETYFMLNRIYLLVAGVLSLTIPFLRPEWFVKQPVTQQIKISVDQLNMMMTQVTVSPDEAAPFNWGQLAGTIYLLGALFFLFRFIYHLVSVKNMIDNVPAGAAFSFFHKKVIDKDLPGLETIYQHEEIHSRQLHTLDVLFFETLAILVWCNPIVYFYKKTVKNIHEYLADEEAARYQGDKESYAILLLSKAFGIDQNVLTNTFFNKSLIKKRIFMLHKERSRKTAILKYGLFLPLFAVTLLLSSATISSNEEIKAVAEEITAPTISIPVQIAEKIDESITKTQLADSWAAFYKHVGRNVNYPASARENELQGNSMITFTITDGEVNGLSVNKQLGLGCDAQVIKSIVSFDDFKNVKDGKYCLKVHFTLSDSKAPVKNETIATPAGYTLLSEIVIVGYAGTPAGKAKTKSDLKGSMSDIELVPYTPPSKNPDTKVYDFVSIETQPSFPGGMTKFYEYIAKTVKYPEEAIKNKIEGKVFLSFIVEKDGEIKDIQVVRPLGGGTDEEAVRILKNSPKWVPGISNGKPVRVKYNIPVSFTLTGEAPKKVMLYRSSSTGSTLENSVHRLYVIDGKTALNNEMDKINPNEISSITVLKTTASLLRFGDEGKNGAILITTKKEADKK